MDVVEMVLALLLAVVVSGFVDRLSPIPLPLPLLQISLGALLSYAGGFQVELHPDVFFLLFLPPLLFLDGWRIPKRGLFRDGWTIAELALGLVLFTVLGIGLFIHWMIAEMPLAVAFALAAVLSPTDPIAVSAVAARVPIPHRLMHILEGESLLNDASSLVCLRFAVAAALTGSFSISSAALTFLQLAVGGIAIGVALTWALMWVLGRLVRRIGEDPALQTLVSLLIPFGAYLAAEHFHFSGILAAVAAGITMNYAEIFGQAQAATRIRRTVVWDMVQFAANGIIFVLLGEQLPGILAGVAGPENGSDWMLAVYVVAIVVALGLLRLGWVWTSLQFTLYRARLKGQPRPRVGWRVLVATSLAGVRGAITLAGVLTLPLVMEDGSPFPARNLAIFLAMGVILVSLVGASVLLPPVLRGLELPPEEAHEREEDEARRAATEAAVKAIHRMQQQMAAGHADAELYAEAATMSMEPYRHRLDGAQMSEEEAERHRRIAGIERKLRLAGLKAERDALFHLRRAQRIEDNTFSRLVREIDLAEARYGA
ncbi:Na+/H+ antiporter [Pseudoroseomonas ludipueritiae]|uniref:Na+/H+ antiporter n=1 Tax=Pseudoroseomonas ludipueritiae TaxID=198093 RepID=A0ABR7R8J0_9PROT|nr:Na+/H+ antiporter [Pseudoroseomonas ludipueritiae]MBC9178019.1 Na+/H+ antiporter [Pseudoroseomonas ludipueritiae]